MCGRYTLTCDIDQVIEEFDIKVPVKFPWTPRYNIAPTQQLPVVCNEAAGRALVVMRWGLVPYWAKDPSIGNRLINARAESVAEKPSFKRSLQSRRCIVPADGFYEWQKTETGKRPLWIHRPDKKVFGFAGLWDKWKSPQGELFSFTIITTDANPFMKPIHDRMPLILSADQYGAWLDPGVTEPDLRAPDLSLSADEVSKAVNSPRVDAPKCIESLTDGDV